MRHKFQEDTQRARTVVTAFVTTQSVVPAHRGAARLKRIQLSLYGLAAGLRDVGEYDTAHSADPPQPLPPLVLFKSVTSTAGRESSAE